MDQEHSARYTDRPGTPEAARAALELAMKPGPNSAYPIEVNLSRLTDELRSRGITITVGRTKSLGAATTDRPAHGGYPAERGEESHAGPVGVPGRPAAAERNRHGAEFGVEVVVSGARFTVKVTADDPISTVIAKALRLAGVPDRVRYLGWTLRTDDGTELDREAPIGSTAAVAAKALFLDPAVGGGGRPDAAPFTANTRVRKAPRSATDIPDNLRGEARRVFKQGGVWLADVVWDNGGTSEGIDCACLVPVAAVDNPHLPTEYAGDLMRKLATGEGWKGTPPAEGTRRALIRKAIDAELAKIEEPAGFDPAPRHTLSLAIADEVESALLQLTIDDEAMARGAEALTDGIEVVSLSARKARGDRRPPWWGETPAEGTRRQLIGNVLRAEDVLSESEIREFADAIELALVEVEALQRTAGETGPVVLTTEIGPDPITELRVVVDDDTPAALMHCGPKFVELEDQAGRSRGCFEWVNDPRKPGLRYLRIPVKPWQPDLDAEGPGDPEESQEDRGAVLSETTGQRIAKALETLTVTAGGALRVLLDTEGMSEPITVPRSALTLVMAAHDNGAHTVDGEALRGSRDVLRELLDRTATDREAR